ncbi:zinc finger MYM-type protein 1-like [Senna tora]|uniref:Zinc finger MYM-type protein 1-like n=1 Tax=Senna tora TaxID=362788 RepID=A0A834TPX4_9FABA|nr:zinc finger MYM-type protein 1-like [Senna tora]
MWDYPINQQDEIRKAYIAFGPYQILLAKFPLSGRKSHPRRFPQQILNNRLRLKSFVDSVGWLSLQASPDESKREQVALMVRFVDKNGFVKERLLDSLHVKETTALTLKKEICSSLSHHNLSTQNIQGQGYDGATHQLQLALIATAKKTIDVHTLFQNLTFIINIVSSSCKRNDELQATFATEIANLIASGEIETGRGKINLKVLC